MSMRTYIQVLYGKAHWKFQAEQAPVFADSIVLVDVTGVAPEPEEGWVYADGSFSPSDAPLPG